MFRRLLVMIGILVFWGNFACAHDIDSAKNCSSIDLRNEVIQGPNALLRQGSRGWCYAFASAVMVSQELGQRVSPLDIALEHNFHTIEATEALHLTAREVLNGHSGRVASAVNDLNDEKGFCVARNLPWFSYRHPNDSIDSATILSRQFEDDAPAEQVINKIDESCGPRIRMQAQVKKLSFIDNNSDREAAIEIIDQQLQQSLIPVYESDVSFFNWASYGLKDPQGRAWHTVNIVGRKFNPKINDCEYVIRDSAQDHSYTDQQSPRYENGYMYATKAQLKEYIAVLFYIEKFQTK